MAREVELTIEDIAFGGKGVGRTEGKAVFVPFVIEEERIGARIIREKKSFAEAELVRLTEVSHYRTKPRCPVFGRCGGCSYQHMTYDHQLHWKSRQVQQALQRIGHFRDPPMRPIVSSPLEYAYRNRITVHADDGVVGFYRHNIHRLIDIDHCPISLPAINKQLSELRARHPRDGHYTLRARTEPRVFGQVNDPVASLLADKIAELISPNETLLIDAYCGAGFFAKRLQAKCSRIVGLDWNIHAIAAAQAEASPTEIYIPGDVAVHLDEQLRQADLSLTTVIVDPPATGLGAEVREILRAHPVATLLYVSCNPPTLARDLADLRAAFELQSVTPFDMFPQTAEIEALAHLRGQPNDHTSTRAPSSTTPLGGRQK